ncbi:hypothetical protein I6G76_10970 [Bacillus cereus]|nr:hypothetical protein [Bacillus cereus]QQA24513.1 hypothetical protein I6G76_10970 [Bacillus cereus]
MNSLIIFLLLLIAFNALIFFIAKKYRQIWKISSGIFILAAPIVFFATLQTVVSIFVSTNKNS